MRVGQLSHARLASFIDNEKTLKNKTSREAMAQGDRLAGLEPLFPRSVIGKTWQRADGFREQLFRPCKITLSSWIDQSSEKRGTVKEALKNHGRDLTGLGTSYFAHANNSQLCALISHRKIMAKTRRVWVQVILFSPCKKTLSSWIDQSSENHGKDLTGLGSSYFAHAKKLFLD